jgi:hypothetical protein
VTLAGGTEFQLLESNLANIIIHTEGPPPLGGQQRSPLACKLLLRLTISTPMLDIETEWILNGLLTTSNS